MRRRWLKLGGFVLVIGAIIAGVRFIAAPAFISTPDAAHVVVTEVHPSSRQGTVVFDQRSSDQASAIYQQLISGGPLTAGGTCPASDSSQPYYHYELTFSHLGVTVATATSDAIGCQDFTMDTLTGPTQYFSWVGHSHGSFWVRLHQLVGAPIPIGICQTMPLCATEG